MKNFQMFLNEQDNFKPPFYKNYVFKFGVLMFKGNKFSWQYFTNFSDGVDAKLTIETFNDGVIFQFIQGTPVISVPVDDEVESGNIVIDDILDFSFSEEYKKLGVFINLNKKYSLKEIL